jgi:hypothetical protein
MRFTGRLIVIPKICDYCKHIYTRSDNTLLAGKQETELFQRLIPARDCFVNGNSWGTSIQIHSVTWNTAFTDRFKWDGGATGLHTSNIRTSLGGTTVDSILYID